MGVHKLYPTDNAFAAVLKASAVVTWGNKHSFGDSSSVKMTLKEVDEIHSTNKAIVAMPMGTTGVTWGDNDDCCNPSRVEKVFMRVEKY